MECTSGKVIESDWTEEIKFDEEYDEFKDDFFNMLSDIMDMWNVLLAGINAVRHQIDLTWTDAKSIHSAPYSAELHVRVFK